MYKNLLQTPPPTKPPNWTRSRIRQQHLIALGVPVNLDEMLPRANGNRCHRSRYTHDLHLHLLEIEIIMVVHREMQPRDLASRGYSPNLGPSPN
jgi:hypothetical protein